MFENYDIIIVGSGLTGATLAERFALLMKKRVLVLEKRDHIGGNCFDYTDEETGLKISKYGIHMFHTNNEDVWKYVNRFSKWKRWDHYVLGCRDEALFPLPVNINTVNHLCGENLVSVEDMENWLTANRIDYGITGPEKGKSRTLCQIPASCRIGSSRWCSFCRSSRFL
jgi:UDP-galactopyranose mutase